jgi:hypothetical protein
MCQGEPRGGGRCGEGQWGGHWGCGPGQEWEERCVEDGLWWPRLR